MALTNFKSSQIVLNVPNKVLGTSISAVSGNAYWPHQNGTGDQWYEGAGATKKYYRWEIRHQMHIQRSMLMARMIGLWKRQKNYQFYPLEKVHL